jgi:hypothetical protein
MNRHYPSNLTDAASQYVPTLAATGKSRRTVVP